MASKRVWTQPWVLLGFVVVLIVIGCVGYHQPATTVEPVTTALVVRHAERSNDSLTPAGRVRAEKLAHVAGEAGVTAIYATEFIRTQQTVQPLAAHLGLPVNLYPAADVEGLVDQILSDHAGEVVLIAGHGDTVPAIIKELGGESMPLIKEYDNLFIVTVYGPGSAKVIHLNYGDAD